MATKRLLLKEDENGHPIQAFDLSASEDIDGTSASVQSSAIDAPLVRISAVGGAVRFLIGANPTALDTSHYLAQGSSIIMPIVPGQKVAVKGNTANIAACGV